MKDNGIDFQVIKYSKFLLSILKFDSCFCRIYLIIFKQDKCLKIFKLSTVIKLFTCNLIEKNKNKLYIS